MAGTDPDQTAHGRALIANALAFKTTNITTEEIATWKRFKRELLSLRSFFEEERNLDLAETLEMETDAVLRGFEYNGQQRYIYVVKVPKY